ncbi:MAG TPA: MFS transporter [Bellilinea sp.]|nr:MFS transporter [Bellilinea sp.]
MRRILSLGLPRQYWLMLLGSLLGTVGRSMIWPFIVLYTSEKTGASLTAVGLILTAEAIAGVLASVIAGPIIDRVGRKWVMVLSLLANGIGIVLMIPATTYTALFLIIVARGALSPLYDIAANAMMVDIMPPLVRVEGFSLSRLVANIGVAIGPMIGGFLVSSNYSIALVAAFIMVTFCGLFFAFALRETLPELQVQAEVERFGGYGRILRDKPFLSFLGAVVLTKVCISVFWMMLSLYMKQDFNFSERLYGFLPMVNAVMIILLQMTVTAWTKDFPRRTMLFVGASLYALSAVSVFFARQYWMFILSTVILTLGELIFEPTSTTEAADLSPESMRGRYMGLFGLTWYAGQSVGPAMSGALSQRFGSSSMWLGAGAAGVLSALMFAVMNLRNSAVNAEAGVNKEEI